MPEDERSPSTGALDALATWDLDIEGRMPWSSNGTFLCSLRPDPGTPADDADEMHAVYKPLRTEQQLWDFPHGLYRREIAAYELGRILGWDLVPETIRRADGPLGVGSLQRFVDADFEQHYFTLLEDPANHPALQRMAVFDVLANNADRKGGHCLVDDDGHIWGIDHGLCFHDEPKLRTVIWDWAGEPIDPELLAPVGALLESAGCAALEESLRAEEITALRERATRLLRKKRFPAPTSERYYPWPLV